MGFAAGFQVGAQAVERGLRMREEKRTTRTYKSSHGVDSARKLNNAKQRRTN